MKYSSLALITEPIILYTLADFAAFTRYVRRKPVLAQRVS